MSENNEKLTVESLIKQFESQLKTEIKSKNTIKNYHCDLVKFFKYTKKVRRNLVGDADTITLGHMDLDFIKSLDLKDIQNFDKYQDKQGMSANTRIRRASSVKAFWEWLIEQRLLDFNIVRGFTSPKAGKRNPIYMTPKEAIMLLNTIKNSDKKSKVRDYAIVLLFLQSGIRREEMVNLNLDSIRDNSMDIIGKGNKGRNVSIDEACMKVINDYLEIRPNMRYENALFLSKNNRRLNVNSINVILADYIKEAGLDSKYTPHKLRHTAATLMYKNGADIRSIQDILGHERIETTQIYTHVDSEDKRKAIACNPISSMI